MDTLHRLAGVTSDTNDAQAQPPHPINNQEAPPLTHDDRTAGQLSHRSSRASLPLHRQPSQKSLRSAARKRGMSDNDSTHLAATELPGQRLGAAALHHAPRSAVPSVHSSDGPAREEDEFIWGPTHPCFPHPNPHCDNTSPTFARTRVIRVRRDFLAAGDVAPQFANLYPEILDPLVSDEEFRFLISGVNTRLKQAFDPFTFRAWVDAVLSVATGFLWDDLGLTGAKSGSRAVEKFLDRWNRTKSQEGKDVQVIQVRRTGFMSLDFVMPDPGIDGLGGENGEEMQATGGLGPAV